MPEQYAFAIGFDRDIIDMSPQQEADWQGLVQHIAQAIAAASLPPLFSERWDEFGHGQVFWGTQSECAAVRQILTQFPVEVQEERNLEEGCYGLGAERYYVTEAGEIYQLPEDSTWDSNTAAQSLSSIPLDAYRLHAIDAQLQTYVETLLQNTSTQEANPIPISAAVAMEGDVLPLQDFSIPTLLTQTPLTVIPSQQVTIEETSRNSESAMSDPVVATFIEDLQLEIESLKGQVVSLSNESAQAKAIAALKIEPAIFETLQQQYVDKQHQLEQLEQHYQEHRRQYALLEAQLAAQSQTQLLEQDPFQEDTVAQTIDVTDGQSLETLSNQIEQQRQQIHDLEGQLEGMHQRLANAVPHEQHETLQQKLAQRNARVVEVEQHLKRTEDQHLQLQSEVQGYAHLQQVHETLQSQLQAKTATADRLQQQVTVLEAEVQQQQEATNLAQARHDALAQDALMNATQMAELERTTQQLEEEVAKWKVIAVEKVDFSEHQRVERELARLRGNLRRGLWGRLFGWLFL